MIVPSDEAETTACDQPMTLRRVACAYLSGYNYKAGGRSPSLCGSVRIDGNSKAARNTSSLHAR